MSRDWWKASAHRAQLRRQRDIDILEKRRSHANFVTSSTQTVEDWPKVTVVQQISPVQSFNKEAREWMKVSHALASTLGHCTNVVREYVAIRDPYRNSESMNKMRVEGLISRIVPSFVPDNIWGLPQRPQTSLPKPLKMSDMQTLFCEIFDPSTDDSQENTQAQQKDSTENQTGVFANVNESNLKSKDESREGQENSEFVQSPSDSSQLWVVQSLVGGQMCRIALEQLLWYSEQRKAGITDKSIQCSAVVANSSVQTDEISQEKPQSCDVEIQTDPPERVKRRLAKGLKIFFNLKKFVYLLFIVISFLLHEFGEYFFTKYLLFLLWKLELPFPFPFLSLSLFDISFSYYFFISIFSSTTF